MKQISGYVLVQGSNTGIAHLTVSAHDTRDMPASPADSREGTAALFQQLGRRLGSVLTDGNGRFELGMEDLHFPGNEARPDLLLTVSAPEDVRSGDDPVPLSPQERLLYISAAARRDAGAEEAFLIRLLPAQLERFGITASSAPGQDALPGARMAETLQAGWDASDLLRTSFQSRLKAQVESVAARRLAAKKATSNLSGIPMYLRGTDNPLRNNAFLIPNREGLTQLAQVQGTALSQGLARLQKEPSPPSLRLYLTIDEIKALGLTVDGNGNVSGEANAAAVNASVQTTMHGFDLIRSRGSSTVDVESLARRYLQKPPSILVAAIRKAEDRLTPAKPAVPAGSAKAAQTPRVKRSK